VELRTEGLTDRGRDGHEFLRERIERVAEAGAETRSREKGPHALDRTVEAISEDPPDAIGWLLLERRALEHLIRLGKGSRTGLRGRAQVPEDSAADHRGQIHLLSETTAMLLIGEDIDGQWQATPGQPTHQALLTQRTHQTIEGHRGEMGEDRAPLQTEAAMGGQQRLTSHLRSHLTRAQDEVGEDREHGVACGALEPPDGDPTEADTRIMGVTGEARAAATGGLVEELKAQGQEKGKDAFDERLPVTIVELSG